MELAQILTATNSLNEKHGTGQQDQQDSESAGSSWQGRQNGDANSFDLPLRTCGCSKKSEILNSEGFQHPKFQMSFYINSMGYMAVPQSCLNYLACPKNRVSKKFVVQF